MVGEPDPVRPPTIRRNEVLPVAADFYALRTDMVDTIQQLAGNTWTDYNAHDPGLTLVEVICYALTDLAYRTGFDIADIAASCPDAKGTSLLPAAWQVIPSQPVTLDDFRRLLLDRVPGLANIWLKPRADTGLLDAFICPQDIASSALVEEQVRRVFGRYRSLGEDLGEVTSLLPLETRLEAHIHLAHGALSEEVLAEALYRVRVLLAPEPRRCAIPDPVPEQTSLFDGPLLLSGLLPDEEIRDKPARIDPREVAAVIRGVPGIIGVHDVRLEIAGLGACETDTVIEIPEDVMCQLRAPDALDTRIAVSRRGSGCSVNWDTVSRLIDIRMAKHRTRIDLRSAYRALYPSRNGRKRALTEFAPLALHFPHKYGLDNEPTEFTEPVAQLAGFLALFEMVMVDFCHRLASIGPALTGRLPNEVEIGSPEFLARISALAALPTSSPSSRPSLSQRLRAQPGQQEAMLDLALTLVGQPVDRVPLPSRLQRNPLAAERHRIFVKRAILAEHKLLSRRDGRGLDYIGRSARHRQSGLELRLAILLGDGNSEHRRRRIAVVEHVLLREALERMGIGLTQGISVIVCLSAAERDDHAFRHEIAALVREAVPAHLAVELIFAGGEQWAAFEPVYRSWTRLLREERAAADWQAAAVIEHLEQWRFRP